MHAVVFQFRPHPEHRDTYFALVAELRPELQTIDGFLENERFAAADDPGTLLSFSFWRDEAAIQRWRAHAGHRVAQLRGRREVFAAYRLRVGEVVEAPDEAPGLLRLTIGKGLEAGGGALYLGITDPENRLVLGEAAAGVAERRLAVRVSRDYGPSMGAPMLNRPPGSGAQVG
jgi:heme-degrading monooxygenase HmoA